MKCYSLGLALDTFRMVALDANFRRLAEPAVAAAYRSSARRTIFLDWDGTLVPTTALSPKPPPEVLAVLQVRPCARLRPALLRHAVCCGMLLAC